MKSLYILKIGGSLITKKEKDEPEVNFSNLKRICKEIGEGYSKIKDEKNLFIIHGAGSYGHVIVKKTGIDSGIKNYENLLDFAETQRLQNELNCIVVKELIRNNVPAFPFQCSSHTIMKKRKLKKMFTDTAEGLLSIGMVPVAFGQPAYDSEQKCSILSGDSIAPFFALKLGAEKIIHATDVDGIFSSDPKKDPNAKFIEEINSSNFDSVVKMLSGSLSIDVTGGMSKKVLELKNLGIESIIINGNVPNLIKSAIIGEKVKGTVIRL